MPLSEPGAKSAKRRQYGVYQHVTRGTVGLDKDGPGWVLIQRTPLMDTRARAMAWAVDYVHGPRARDE
jgi:hypothetical protein